MAFSDVVGENRQGAPSPAGDVQPDCPTESPGAKLLTAALTERGVDAAWAEWDDPEVDWGAADLASRRCGPRGTTTGARRSSWPGPARWSRGPTLLNGAELFAWNADKAYLVGLGEHLPCVPTALLEDRTLVAGLPEAAARWVSAAVS